jgi:undecaprenyl-diphosphatase
MPITPTSPVPPEHRRRLERLRGVLGALWAGAGLLLLLFIFVKLGSEMREGETRRFDMVLLRFFQQQRIANPWLTDAMRDLSGLGGTVVLVLFTTITAGYLALVKERSIAILVIATTAGCGALVEALKLAFDRSRPEASYAAIAVPGLSFPSGHATLSAIVFLTLGALASSTRQRTAERTYIMVAAAGMTVLVGLSRVALGVHWATDVLAGWAFGALWAAACLLMVHRITAPAR